jgi:NADP-dependent 3-hydroxy acid dehydrogenase YdfG
MLCSPTIIITGASSGIGAATARVFADQGYCVALAARRLERLEALAQEIESADGKALPVATDVTRLDDIQNLVQATLDRFGQIDVLFNNAGFGRLDWLENLDPVNDIEAQFRVNLLGMILITRVVVPHMIERRTGHIINMGSIAGLVATPTYTVYSATKFAVRGFTEALRREVGIYGVHVSGIYPGGVATEFRQHTGAKRVTGATTPNSLRLSPEDVAQEVWRLVKRPRRTVIAPGVMRLAVWLNALLPGWVDRLIERRFTRIERGE